MMTLAKLRGFGMDSKNTKSLTAGALIALSVGFAIGLLINDIPYISFKREVDLGSIIAILGLITTIFIMPFIVQRRLSHYKNINSVILVDIESIHLEVSKLREFYVDLKPTTKINQAKHIHITTSFRTISAQILALSKELDARKRLPNFKIDVYDKAYENAYETCTELLRLNGKLDNRTILSASKSLNDLVSELKKYRFSTFE